MYRIFLDEPGSPEYLVYNKEVANKLLDKLLVRYGKQFSIALKKVEVPQ